MSKLKTEFDALIKQMTPVQQAEMVLPIYEAEYPDDKAPHLAIAAAKVDELTEDLIDDVYESRLGAYATTPASYAASVCCCIEEKWICGSPAVGLARRAFTRTTDELRRKVIETGKDILKRDKENDQ